MAVGTRRILNAIQNTPTTTIVQLIERVSFGRKIQLGTIVDDGKGGTIVKSVTPIVTIDYQRVKSICSIEQGVSIAYRTICKCLGDPKPSFVMPSFIYTMPPVLFIGQTNIPADSMFICRVTVPSTIKYAIDTPLRGSIPKSQNISFLFTLLGFGKLWISRTRKLLCGVQLVSEHALMFGKAFGILIRNQILPE